MEKRQRQRIRRRITCELVHDGQPHRGIVLDLSETGLFVQTVATPAPGTALRLRLRAAGSEEVEVDAVVARRLAVPPPLNSVARGGIGLRLQAPPASYFRLLRMEADQAAARATERADGEEARSALRSAGEPASARPASSQPAAADARPTFRVRVKECGGPRSRSLLMRATSEDDARQQASAQIGSGWEVLSVEVI
jgi:hypothetical protein